jgi:predicted signal transduction protein with EAL and GGDEF domain
MPDHVRRRSIQNLQRHVRASGRRCAVSGIGQILKDQLRESDIVCRYAGDEFVIVLPDATETGAQKAALKIKTAVAAHPFKRQVTVNLGVAKYQEGMTPKDLIQRADTALFFSKHAGRDQVCIYSDEMGIKSDNRIDNYNFSAIIKKLTSKLLRRMRAIRFR